MVLRYFLLIFQFSHSHKNNSKIWVCDSSHICSTSMYFISNLLSLKVRRCFFPNSRLSQKSENQLGTLFLSSYLWLQNLCGQNSTDNFVDDSWVGVAPQLIKIFCWWISVLMKLKRLASREMTFFFYLSTKFQQQLPSDSKPDNWRICL